MVLTSLRALRLLALTVWLGSLVFFAAVLAPVAFSPAVIAQTHSVAVSATIVGMGLGRLHWMGLVCGVVLLAAAGLLRWMREMGVRLAGTEAVVVAAMMALTAYSQYSIIPRMERDRAIVGPIAEAPDSPEHEEFDRLHGRSVQVESGVLVGGLVLLVLIAAEWPRGVAGASRS